MIAGGSQAAFALYGACLLHGMLLLATLVAMGARLLVVGLALGLSRRRALAAWGWGFCASLAVVASPVALGWWTIGAVVALALLGIWGYRAKRAMSGPGSG